VGTNNITLALPEDLLRRLEILATRQDSSLSALLTAALSDLADREEGYSEAATAMLRDMERGYDSGTRGYIVWTRDDLHFR
jgi:predicted transcriptional regulator